MVNGMEWDNVIITIAGVEIKGVKSIVLPEHSEVDFIQEDFDMLWDPVRWPKKITHYDPTIIEVMAKGMFNAN